MHVIWADKNARGPLKLVSRFEYRHARVFAGARVGAGLWLLILTAILYGYDRGGWWRVLLIPAAAGAPVLRLAPVSPAPRSPRGGFMTQDIQPYSPSKATPVGHAGTRVVIHERPAWAINGWIGVLVVAACIVATILLAKGSAAWVALLPVDRRLG